EAVPLRIGRVSRPPVRIGLARAAALVRRKPVRAAGERTPRMRTAPGRWTATAPHVDPIRPRQIPPNPRPRSCSPTAETRNYDRATPMLTLVPAADRSRRRGGDGGRRRVRESAGLLAAAG